MAVVERRRPDETTLLLAFGLVVGAVLRLVNLNKQSFWFDESFSWDASTKSFHDMLGELVADFVHPPLHYIFLHGWFKVWDGPAAARALMVVFGIASLPAIYWLGCELYDRRTAAIGVVLMAVSQLGIAYSQEVRPYSQLVFFTLVTTAFYVRAINRRSLGALLCATICAILALGTHYYAAFVIAGIAVWHVVFARTRLPLSWIGLSFAIGVAASLPWLLSGVIGEALDSPKTTGDQPSWFSVNWSTPFEALSAFSDARLASVLSTAHAPWTIIASSALFVGPALLMLRRPWMRSFITIGVVLCLGALSGFGKWVVLATILTAALHGVDAIRDLRMRRLAMAAFVLVVLAVSALAELRAAPVFVCVVLGVLISVPLRAWLPDPASRDESAKREVLLAILVACTVVTLTLAGLRGVPYDVRYTLAALGPFYLLTARALGLLTSPVLRRSWLAAIVAFSALGIRSYFEYPTKENYRDALALLHDRYQPGDCASFVPFYITPTQWRVYGYDDVQLRTLDEAELKSGAPGCREEWLVFYERVEDTKKRGEIAEAAFAQRHELIETQQFHWVRVAHYR